MIAFRSACALVLLTLVLACSDDTEAPSSSVDGGPSDSDSGAPDTGTHADSSPPGPALANLWINTSAGSCTRSATPVPFDAATACGPDFDGAWNKASAGDTIGVAAGTYGPQRVTGDKTSETRIVGMAGVTIAGTVECKPEFGSDGVFCANAAYLTLKNVILDSQTNVGSSAGSQINAAHVTYENVSLHGQYPAIYIVAPSFTWRRGSHGQDGVVAGPWKCDRSYGEPVQIDEAGAGATLDGIRFNPKTIQAGAGPFCGPDDTPHLETIRINDASDVTVKDSWFLAGSDAGSGHIFTSTSPANLKLFNNVFEPVNGSYAIQATAAATWLFAYNTFEQAVLLDTGAFPWIGNLGIEAPDCTGTHVKNLWQGSGSCGTDTFVGTASLGIGNGGHLNAGSVAIDAAETPGADDFCTHQLGAVDFEGTVRPKGAACDVGAHEH